MRKIFLNTMAYQTYIQNQNVIQEHLIEMIADHGFDGVELRREFFINLGDELMASGKAARSRGLIVFYSVPADLFCQGQLNPNLSLFIKEAELLGASRIKFGVGEFQGFTREIASSLNELMRDKHLRILVENDQTQARGTLSFLSNFLEEVSLYNISIGLLCDVGNFYYAGEDTLKVIPKLIPHLEYLHLKNMAISQLKIQSCLKRGDIDLLKLLEEIDERVPVAIESMYEGNLEEINRAIQQDLNFLMKNDVQNSGSMIGGIL
ncbi:TIM barrel protein [Facklamia sp. DSM 111018]|uniref:TIM barrel protein n=1 Tax=Facklamia lactis TaxID=2749967 RepID=A0ABS0LPU4_9LACT|nr:sugar phosphate isomerase/epimerase [Facklamia lactis]MBG9986093.1 TIM barrel protein [Facklamia lactis]